MKSDECRVRSDLFQQSDQRRMYADLAWAGAVFSHPDHYAEEAGQFHQLIQSYSRILVRTLLDLGCGAGHNDFHLKRHYQLTAGCL